VVTNCDHLDGFTFRRFRIRLLVLYARAMPRKTIEAILSLRYFVYGGMNKYINEALMVCHQQAEWMHGMGIINDDKMREFDEGCLVREFEMDDVEEKWGTLPPDRWIKCWCRKTGLSPWPASQRPVR